jgi:hypothetical protein
VFDCETFNQGVCDNTCETVCNQRSSTGSEICFGNGGEQTTCGNYNKFVQCGDGVCSADAGEVCVCSECAIYCIATEMPNGLKDALANLTENSYEDSKGACLAAVAYEWTDEWDCPTFDWVSGFEYSNPSCEAKNHALDEIHRGMNDDRAMGNYLYAAGGCSSTSSSLCDRANAFLDRANSLAQDYDDLNSIPCYMFTGNNNR